jgi:dTDP-4-amino-4,6-dideoxygalactose transaminase
MKRNVGLYGVFKNEQMESLALEVLRSGQIASGEYVSKFTDGFGKLVDQKNVVTVNDMSNAIQIALRLSGVQSGDDVLTTSYACMSTNAPISTSGAKPIWVDVDPRTGLMDPIALERAITPKSKAVIVYHLSGYPAQVDIIAKICADRGLKLIEDCDNALLATVAGQQVGTFGDFAVYSFYPNRQINATEGGALCCRIEEDAERAIRLRRYGIDLSRFRDNCGEINSRYDIPEVGWAATLNNLCSAVGYAQLSGAFSRIVRARDIAARYIKEFSVISEIDVVMPPANSMPTYWTFLVRVQNRDNVMRALKVRGIHSSKLHHRTDLYSGFNTDSSTLPETQDFLNHVLALPCGWWMSDEDVHEVVHTLTQIVREQIRL